jgi:hypothetical protein
VRNPLTLWNEGYEKKVEENYTSTINTNTIGYHATSLAVGDWCRVSQEGIPTIKVQGHG